MLNSYRNIRIMVIFVWYNLMKGAIFCAFAVRNDTMSVQMLHTNKSTNERGSNEDDFGAHAGFMDLSSVLGRL